MGHIITLSLINGPRTSWCKVEGVPGMDNVRMLNKSSLEYFLKKQLHMDKLTRVSIMTELEAFGAVSISLYQEAAS